MTSSQENSAGFFFGVNSFLKDIQTLDFSVDDAVDLAWLFSQQLKTITTKNITLAITGTPSKQTSIDRLKKLESWGINRLEANFVLILDELKTALQRTNSDGFFVSSFSSHGYMKNGDYILCYDSSPNHLDKTSLLVQDIINIITVSRRAKSRLVLFDTCRENLSGSKNVNVILDSATAMSESVNQTIKKTKGTAILFSTVPHGYSFEDKEQENGLFTSRIIMGLLGKAEAKDGYITPESLSSYVNNEVRAWVKIHKPDHQERSGITFNIDDLDANHIVLAKSNQVTTTSQPKKKCILLLSQSLSKEQKQESDYLIKNILTPACKEVSYKLFTKQKGYELLDSQFSELSYTQLVIAYLDREDNDDLLMAQIGFRLASGKPIICLQNNIGRHLPANFRRLAGVGSYQQIQFDNILNINTIKNEIKSKIQFLEKEYSYNDRNNVYPTTFVKIEDVPGEESIESYIDCDKEAAVILSGTNNPDPFEIINQQGEDIAKNLIKKIIPSQWNHFIREQIRLYEKILNPMQHKETPVAKIPMVFESENGLSAILPLISKHASEGSCNQFKIIHIDVSQFISQYADGHYELSPSIGRDGIKELHNFRQEYYYAISPAFKFNSDGKIIDFNLAMSTLLGEEANDFLKKTIDNIKSNFFNASEIPNIPMELNIPFSEFPREMQKFSYHTNDFGNVTIRGYIMPLLDIVLGERNGYTWNWEVVDIDKEEAYHHELIIRFKKSYLWNHYAASYDQVLPFLSYYEDLVERHVKLLKPCQKIADIGAGTGNLVVRLLELGKHVTAIDVSKSMICRIEAKVAGWLKEEYRIIHHSAEQLPMLPDGAFDGVSAMMSLYDMENPELALHECARILKRGGIIVITDPKPGISKNVEIIISNSDKELQKNPKLIKKLSSWEVVKACGRELSKSAESSPYPDDFINILKKIGFDKFERRESHFDTCETIMAIKS